MKHAKGFTLIELMIAVVVVSILAAIALPAYTNYTKRGKISEATTNLSSLRVSMEQYYQDNRTYLNGAACGVTMPTTPAVQYFTYTCAATQNTYTITATGSTGMPGFAYTVDQNNAKQTTALPADWSSGVTLPVACWVSKPGGTC
ncbi:MAG: prepilin-type N-terminal cleavage/methylation domain-containing protein [Sideroxydans sp.]|nr:prepilin-type N-terminal cleavage/methylation domain-containing protein [Sideroxydans sp.]